MGTIDLCVMCRKLHIAVFGNWNDEIMRKINQFFFTVTISLISLSIQGEFSTPIDPLRGLSTIGLEVMIGRGLEVGPHQSQGVFGDDKVKAESFKSALRKGLKEHLKLCDIQLADGAEENKISVSVFGRESEIGPPKARIFFVDLAIWREYESAQESDCPPCSEGSALGIAFEKDLESALVRAVIGLLEQASQCPVTSVHEPTTSKFPNSAECPILL